MSLYDFALGDGHQQHRGALLLALLGFPPVVRFRDAWVETSDDGPVIVIYTRQGGPNREEDYCAGSNQALAAHPLYLRDRDGTLIEPAPRPPGWCWVLPPICDPPGFHQPVQRRVNPPGPDAGAVADRQAPYGFTGRGRQDDSHDGAHDRGDAHSVAALGAYPPGHQVSGSAGADLFASQASSYVMVKS